MLQLPGQLLRLLLSQDPLPLNCLTDLALDAETSTGGTQREDGKACTDRSCRERKEQEFAASQTAGAVLLMMVQIVLIDIGSRSFAGIIAAAVSYGVCSLQ